MKNEKTSKRQRAARGLFMRRSYSIYKHMVDRLRGQPFHCDVPFPLDDLRDKIRAALNTACAYCGTEVTAKNFSADHMLPLNRADEINGIAWLTRLGNIAICCTSCQRMKGALDDAEYRQLLALIKELDEIARRDITRRLKAGGAVIRCGIARI